MLVAPIPPETLDLPFQVRCMRLLEVWQDPQGDEPGDLWVFTSKTSSRETLPITELVYFNEAAESVETQIG